MGTRAEGIKWAAKLQQALGSDYLIEYDALESATTCCYYKGELYKQVPNEEMRGSINVADYAAPTSLKIRLQNGF